VPLSDASAEVDLPMSPEERALDAYGKMFVKAYAGQLGLQVASYGPGEVEDVKHWVLHYARSGEPHRYLTVGLGRQPQMHAVAEAPPYVELLAEIDPSEDADLVSLLSQLGGWLHTADRPVHERFKQFSTLRVGKPLLGISDFILVPNGEVTIVDRTITVLRVIPMAANEYDYIKMRGEGAARAWWDRLRGDPALSRRWSSAVGEPFVP
jgi:hypothetical protein